MTKQLLLKWLGSIVKSSVSLDEHRPQSLRNAEKCFDFGVQIEQGNSGKKSLNTRVDIQMFNEMTHFPLSYCSVCFWSWRTNQREKAWQILYKTVTSVFFCSSLGPEEADFTLSCQCFSSFSFLPLKIHNFWKTWKCKAKLYLFFFFFFYYFILFPVCWFIFREIWIRGFTVDASKCLLEV